MILVNSVPNILDKVLPITFTSVHQKACKIKVAKKFSSFKKILFTILNYNLEKFTPGSQLYHSELCLLPLN